MVYFAQLPGGCIKIGTAVNVKRRLASLKSWYGRLPVLLAVIPGGREEELATHRRFSHLRVRRTEQFYPAPELIEFIGRPVLFHVDPELPIVSAIEGPAGVRELTLQVWGRDQQKLHFMAEAEGLPIEEFAEKHFDVLIGSLWSEYLKVKRSK